MAGLKDSRLGPGTLTLGAVEYGAQIPNVTLTPSQESVDGVATLADITPTPQVTTSWELKGKAIQDWEDAAGLTNYLFDNDGDTVAFVWTPNTAKGVAFAGDCVVVTVEIGGDVNVQNTSDFSFAVKGTPTRTAGV